MSGSFDFIRTEAARDAVERLGRTDEALAAVDTKISQAISWGDLSRELAGAHMLVGELLDEVPALLRTVEFKVEQMLATQSSPSLAAMYANWQYQAQRDLVAGLDDEFRAGPDAGGTYSQSYRGGLDVDGDDSAGVGTNLVAEMLRTTGDGSQIAQDEFQLVVLDNGKFVVVLPGVTDLSSPDLGVNGHHRTVRDLDQYAFESAASTGIDGNAYAQMVQRAMVEASVPYGADVAIVGHSFGADTALDLAADEGFNGGPSGYNVTHVIAAGYHSGPQLEYVSASTEVLVLQNHHDVAILAEAWGHGAGEIIHGDLPLPNRVTQVPGRLAVDTSIALGQSVVDAGGFIFGSVLNLGGDVINVAADATGLADDELVPHVHINDFDDIFLMDDGVSEPRPNQIVDVFEGAWEGAGHHPNNYADHVATTDDEAIREFLESIGADYGGRMERWSVDVSVPHD